MFIQEGQKIVKLSGSKVGGLNRRNVRSRNIMDIGNNLFTKFRSIRIAMKLEAVNGMAINLSIITIVTRCMFVTRDRRLSIGSKRPKELRFAIRDKGKGIRSRSINGSKFLMALFLKKELVCLRDRRRLIEHKNVGTNLLKTIMNLHKKVHHTLLQL